MWTYAQIEYQNVHKRKKSIGVAATKENSIMY
jgi:hypothetical protein